LTSALGYAAWVQESRYNEQAFLWGQYWTWGPGVSLGNDARYVAEPDDHNNLWARAYSNALADLRFLTQNEDPAYSAVGKIMTAYIYQGLVDHFGDVPYSNALLGEIADGSVLTPEYDDAATIYVNLIALLDDALTDLDRTAGNEIHGEDLIFGGDLSHWATFGKSLQLRILMRQSGVADVEREVEQLVQEGDLIHNSAEIAQMAFAGTSGDENPMYASMESGIGNFYVASNASLNVLRALNDPRISALYDVAPNIGEIVGVDQGSIDNEPFTAVREDYSQGTAVTYGPGNPVIFMSDWEVWFLRAEAAARFGTADDEATAFANGIAASFAYLGVANPGGYTASLGYDTGASIDERLRMIATQKWIAMNGLQEDEGWIEARRFDTPGNPIFTDLDNGIFQTPTRTALAPGVHPSAFLYPESEQSLNPNSPAQRILTDKVFWDN
ncbi:MAG: SusD/RagB family nutrient-binding outer membrane lipoprotein, partial [Bacteroidota bacterium]